MRQISVNFKTIVVYFRHTAGVAHSSVKYGPIPHYYYYYYEKNSTEEHAV